MKTVIILIIVVVIAYFSIKSLIESLRGKGGCSCSNSGNCSIRKSCPSQNIKNK